LQNFSLCAIIISDQLRKALRNKKQNQLNKKVAKILLVLGKIAQG
jgi:hypothetical protein